MLFLMALLIGTARPPAAYVATGAAHVPLAITSWCWDARCGAPLGQSAGRVVTSRGALVRVELKLEPVQVSATVGGAPAHAVSRGTEVRFPATRAGGLSLYVRYRHGWVTYAARLVVR